MSQEGLEAALGKIPSGIYVVTAKRGEQEAALLASWIQQASFKPPTISIAVHRDRPIYALLSEQAFFAVHILSPENQELYRRFVQGAPDGVEPFKGLQTEMGRNNVPILKDALAVMECRVRQRVDVGDHDLIVADVVEGRMLSEGEPRVHVRKNGMNY